MWWDMATAEAVLGSPRPELEVGSPVNQPVVVVDVDQPGHDSEADIAGALAGLAVVSIGTGAATSADWDVIAADPRALVEAVNNQPDAAVVAAEVLRANEADPAPIGRQRESLAYGILQASPAHREWLDSQGSRTRNDTAPRVRVDRERNPDRTVITLTRGRLHNQLDRQMRDELADAFLVAADTTGPVRWQAQGPSFCAGGDLGEFGTATSPARSHAVRGAANVADHVEAVATRLQVDVHGAAVGAGIELAALAHRVVATPDASFALPELRMGLIPGAGGTVSIPRRIGRQRTMAWLLQGTAIDAGTAQKWGLIDEISGGTAGPDDL